MAGFRSPGASVSDYLSHRSPLAGGPFRAENPVLAAR
jgi:hypothetical protein